MHCVLKVVRNVLHRPAVLHVYKVIYWIMVCVKRLAHFHVMVAVMGSVWLALQDILSIKQKEAVPLICSATVWEIASSVQGTMAFEMEVVLCV